MAIVAAKVGGEADCRRGELQLDQQEPFFSLYSKERGRERKTERLTEGEIDFLSQDMFHLGMLCDRFSSPLDVSC